MREKTRLWFGGRADEYKAARRRKEAVAIASENRRAYQRIASVKSHYSNADAAKHARKHRTVLEMHHEAGGDLPDMTSDLTKEPRAGPSTQTTHVLNFRIN